MGDQIGGVMWCSSGRIFGYCCYGGLCLGQVECVTSAPTLVPLEVGNHHHRVLLSEPLEVWYHREWILVLGYVVFLPLIAIYVIV